MPSASSFLTSVASVYRAGGQSLARLGLQTLRVYRLLGLESGQQGLLVGQLGSAVVGALDVDPQESLKLDGRAGGGEGPDLVLVFGRGDDLDRRPL